jgi:hypothetical protein
LGRREHRIDVNFAEKGIETFSVRRMRDDMEKIIRSGLIAALLMCPMQALAQHEPTPMDKVRVLAGEHTITTGKRHGVYWVEVEGSDIFGTGTTLDEAALDFLADADLEGHEANRPNLRTLPQETKPQINCAEEYCL